MTTIKINEYIFSVDTKKTREYYKSHFLCECVRCRNYYAQIKDRLPKLAEFLNEFGIDISRPDEIFSFEKDDSIYYINIDYSVCGHIETMGSSDIIVKDNLLLNIDITNGFVSPNEQTGEYFTISVTSIELPWVLDEPFPTAIKVPFEPKTKSFLKKLFRK